MIEKNYIVITKLGKGIVPQISIISIGSLK
ncbi:MAG: hypothetical protein ACJAUH_001726 [Saprospiraceae bacterium]|jgi:hypothetical protein